MLGRGITEQALFNRPSTQCSCSADKPSRPSCRCLVMPQRLRPASEALRPADWIQPTICWYLPYLTVAWLGKADLTTGAPRDRTGEELFTREFTEPLVPLIGYTLSDNEQQPRYPLSSRPVQQDAQHCERGGNAADHTQPEQFDPTRSSHRQIPVAAPFAVQPSCHRPKLLRLLIDNVTPPGRDGTTGLTKTVPRLILT